MNYYQFRSNNLDLINFLIEFFLIYVIVNNMDSKNNNPQVKVSDDDQSEIVALNSEYQNLLLRLGQLNLKKINLKTEMNALKKEEKNCKKSYFDLTNKETIFMERLKKKYGEGSLDIESGIYIKR
mgnify:CR=1 FL=1